jgi:hypothetical protein
MMVIWCLGWLVEKLGDLLAKLCGVWDWLNSLGRDCPCNREDDDE